MPRVRQRSSRQVHTVAAAQAGGPALAEHPATRLAAPGVPAELTATALPGLGPASARSRQPRHRSRKAHGSASISWTRDDCNKASIDCKAPRSVLGQEALANTSVVKTGVKSAFKTCAVSGATVSVIEASTRTTGFLDSGTPRYLNPTTPQEDRAAGEYYSRARRR